MHKSLRSALTLLLAAMIWGFAFVAQSVGGEHLGSFTFNCVRSLIGAASIAFIILMRTPGSYDKPKWKDVLIGGFVCGLFLTFSVNFQQSGLTYVDTTGLTEAEAALAESATVGKVGFLTALYIVLVPVLGLFIGRKTRPIIWVGVVVAVVGMYFLCVKDGLSIGKGDLMVIGCAFMFTLQIFAIDYFVRFVNCLYLSCAQFIVCGLLSGVGMLLWEQPTLSALGKAWMPILYMGVMSSGVAYTLQIAGQRHTKPAVAALIMSLESVFAALFGLLFLNETMSAREVLGCALMFAAIIITQLPLILGRQKP